MRLEAGALDGLSDEELVAYVVAAREAGYPEAGKRAADMIAFRIQPLIEARVAAKVGRDDREDVVMETLLSFMRSAFDGKVIDSVRAFAATIAKRRIADHYRQLERHPDQVPLSSENLDQEGVWGAEPTTADETAVLGIEDVIRRVLERRNGNHRRIIELYGPEVMGGGDLTGAEVVEAMAAEGESVSISNVQQVWHRFKVELAKELQTGEDGMDPDG